MFSFPRLEEVNLHEMGELSGVLLRSGAAGDKGGAITSAVSSGGGGGAICYYACA